MDAHRIPKYCNIFIYIYINAVFQNTAPTLLFSPPYALLLSSSPYALHSAPSNVQQEPAAKYCYIFIYIYINAVFQNTESRCSILEYCIYV